MFYCGDCGYDVAIHIKRKDWDIMSYLYSSLLVLNYFLLYDSCLLAYFFCRLKINHDSHEFILEFGTVANHNDISLVF
jgi:hypothetical protein